MMDFDVIVLGAGIVGVSVALHLQARERRVALIDRRGPGEETSFGNAGLIERSMIVPHSFPRQFSTLMRYARNRSTDVYWEYNAFPSYASWLIRYWRESSVQRLATASRDILPLVERCIIEHEALIARAKIGELVHDNGWLQAFRTPNEFDRKATAAHLIAREHHLRLVVLDQAALHRKEPSLAKGFCGALHWLDTKNVVNPGALTKSYARLFETDGGALLLGDATTLTHNHDAWTVQTAQCTISAKEVVIALGPWSNTVLAPLGYRIPLRAKRGYHMHYLAERAPLSTPILDAEQGYVIAPMQGQLRLTTGIEIAHPRTPPTGVQLARAEQHAKPLFGLGARVHPQPWFGMRPCTPDMRPVIGPAPRHRGMWFAFGHHHLGLTLGPVTGRLLAEMMTGATPFTHPHPYRAERFD